MLKLEKILLLQLKQELAGSSKIGKNCVIGGQVKAYHITIGDNVKIQGQSGVISNIKDNMKIQGTPAFSAMIITNHMFILKTYQTWVKK